jgi:hypothetical protein
MTTNKINFIHSTSTEEIEQIYNFNVKAFADSHDFLWTPENIKSEIQDGWHLYSVRIENDIICALFLKEEDKTLYTKNTPVKLNYQGNGFSHIIKEFYEEYATDKKLDKLVNYCPVDNFRMIALNEGHDYSKTGRTLGGNEHMLEWEKSLNKD